MRNFILFLFVSLSVWSAAQKPLTKKVIRQPFDSLVHNVTYVDKLLKEGSVFLEEEIFVKAKAKADTALRLSLWLEDGEHTYRSYLFQAEISKRRKGPFGSPEKDYIQALQVAKSLKRDDLYFSAADSLHAFYVANRKFDKAYPLYQELIEKELTDEKEVIRLNEHQLNDSIAKLSHTLSEAIQQNNRLEEKRSQNEQFLYIAAGAFVILLVLFIVLLLRKSKKKEAPNQMESHTEEKVISIKDKESEIEKQIISRKSKKEAEKMRYLIGTLIREREDSIDFIDKGIGSFVSEMRSKLKEMSSKQGDKIPVEDYLALQNMLSKVFGEVRSITGSNPAVSGSFHDRVENLCEHFSHQRLTVTCVDKLKEVQLTSHQQSALLYALHEIFANIEEHSDASEVQVQISQVNNKVQLVVEDNGRGFDINTSITVGRGLRKIIALITYLHGDLDIVSGDRKGAKYIISLNLKSP